MAIRNSVVEKKNPGRRAKAQRQATKEFIASQSVLLELVPTGTTGDVIEVDESQSKGYEMVMSITESSSKIHEPKLYEEAVNDLIHGRQWQKAIEEELQNLENHRTWIYNELPHDRKAIGLK